MGDQKEIYFHVGLGKVASTFLQYRFFPQIDGLQYIQRTKYKRAHSLIEKSNSAKILLSREFDQQFERELLLWSDRYPQMRIILLFRRHDSWIASQYRRYVKNGGSKNFSEFYSEDGTAPWGKRDLDYPAYVEFIKAHFDHAPLILSYDQLQRNPVAFFDSITNYMGVPSAAAKVNRKPLHRSYSEQQLLAMRLRSRMFGWEDPGRKSNNEILHWFQRRTSLLRSYFYLYGEKLWGISGSNSQGPLIDPQELKEIRERYQQDWQWVEKMVAENLV